MNEPPSQTVRAVLVWKTLGVLLALALAGLGLAALLVVKTLLDRPNAAVVATIPDVLAIWREPSSVADGWSFVLIILPPLVLIPPVFGLRHPQLPSISTRARWGVVVVSALLMVAGVTVGAVFGRDEVAVATPFGVSWLKDGKPREYWSWGAATNVAAGCVRSDKSGDFVLNYDVTFPTGREARLIQTEDEFADVVPRLAVVDQRLRASGAPRFVHVEDGCLGHYARDLTSSDRATFGTLLNR